MPRDAGITIDYRKHDGVERLLHHWRATLEEIALGFNRWEEARVYGPGMYVAIVVGPSLGSYADPMGANRWPADGIRDVSSDWSGSVEAATAVAYSQDGAVVCSVDGVVNQQLVRFRTDMTDQELPYQPWMGSRHMSALDMSTLDDVIATVTLSQESGRVTVFEDGTFESQPREALGGRWRVEAAVETSVPSEQP